MGCRPSRIKRKSNNINITLDPKAYQFSIDIYRRFNPKHLRLSKGLFKVKEVSPSREMSYCISPLTKL